MAVKKTNTSEVELRPLTLIYGQPGVGKTSSIRTLPESETIIIASEKGLGSLKNFNYDVLQVESWSDVRDVYGLLRTDEYLKKYKYVVFDTFTAVLEMNQTAILKKASSMASSIDTNTFMTLQRWMDHGGMICGMLDSFKSLPYITILLCHEKKVENDSLISFEPAISGNMIPSKIDTSVELYLRMVYVKPTESDKETRKLVTVGCTECKAKHPGNWLQPVMSPDLGKIFQIITERKNEKIEKIEKKEKDNGNI